MFVLFDKSTNGSFHLF